VRHGAFGRGRCQLYRYASSAKHRKSKETRVHTSRPAGFMIDCRIGEVSAAAKFLGTALGGRLESLPPEDSAEYSLRATSRRFWIDGQCLAVRDA